MLLSETTAGYQSALARFCRSGEPAAIPGTHATNLHQYRRLVYNVVDDMLQHVYPLTNALLDDTEWEQLVQEFFRNHPCSSYQVWNMPKELYHYLAAAEHPLKSRYPFLLELLWFEWIEVALFMMEDIETNVKAEADIETEQLVLNPEHVLLAFEYPVHQKKAVDITAQDKGNYFLVAHRDSTGAVFFTSLSAAIYQLMIFLEETPLSIDEMLQRFSTTYGITITPSDRKGIVDFFSNALVNNLVAGFAVR